MSVVPLKAGRGGTKLRIGFLRLTVSAPAMPLADTKPEGAHAAPWPLSASHSPIAMDPDSFCDGAIFDFTKAAGGVSA